MGSMLGLRRKGGGGDQGQWFPLIDERGRWKYRDTKVCERSVDYMYLPCRPRQPELGAEFLSGPLYY